MQFSLVTNYLWFGVSFRQAKRVMMEMKERTGLVAISSYSDYTVYKYALFSCEINPQKIVELIDSAWMFSVALDMSTHMSTSYLKPHPPESQTLLHRQRAPTGASLL